MVHRVFVSDLSYPELIRRLEGLAEGVHPGADRYLVLLRDERAVVQPRCWLGWSRWQPRLLITAEPHGTGCRMVVRPRRGVSDSVQIGLVLTWAGALGLAAAISQGLSSAPTLLTIAAAATAMAGSIALLLRLADRQNAASLARLCDDVARVIAGGSSSEGASARAAAIPRSE